MGLAGLFTNYILIAGLASWTLAQILKVPVEFFQTGRWNWALLLQAGGMPSSHSALVTAIAQSIGLFVGFNSPLFALSAAVALIVIYDATGIRRQSGIHAAKINALIEDLVSGHPLKGEQLREVLGHTPLEALGGVILGLFVAQLAWIVWGKA